MEQGAGERLVGPVQGLSRFWLGPPQEALMHCNSELQQSQVLNKCSSFVPDWELSALSLLYELYNIISELHRG